MPCRASLYSGWPFCFSAEYIGGSCSIAPRKSLIASSTAASVTPEASLTVSVSPSASAVAVVRPSVKVLSYPLSASSRYWENFVASPKHSGKTPVANGSRLPVCPAFAASYNRLARCNDRFELSPRGLSSTRMPFTGRPRRRLPTLPSPHRRTRHCVGLSVHLPVNRSCDPHRRHR